MAWTIEFARSVEKDLRMIGPEAARRILRSLRERLAALDDPRSIGEPLHGPELGRFWKYRVGVYGVIASIQDDVLVILIVRVDHRRDVYQRRLVEPDRLAISGDNAGRCGVCSTPQSPPLGCREGKEG